LKKVAFIADSDTALRFLRVCPEVGDGEYNCGRCEKCVRTMINLELEGKLGQCPTFDQPLEARSIRRLRAKDTNRGYYRENLAALKEQGIRPDLQRALKYILRRPRWLERHRVKRFLRSLLPKCWQPAKNRHWSKAGWSAKALDA